MRPSFVPLSALGFVAAHAIGVFAPATARAQAPNAPPAPGAPQSPATPNAPNAPSTPAAPGTAPGTPGTTGGSTPGTAPGTGGVSGQTTSGQNTATTPASQTGQLGGSVPRPGANPSPVYDVSRAIQEAIGASSELILARRNVQIDENRADEVSSQGRFNVTGNGSATRFDQATQIAIGGGPPIQVIPSHQEALSLVVSQRLDFLGQIRAETRQARLQTEADRANLDRIVNDRSLQAQQIFYNLLRAYHQVQVAQSALASAQNQETIARRLYEGQIGQKIDYLRASTQTAQAVQDLQRAENDLGLARASFNDLVGRPLNSPVEPVDVPGVSVGVDVPRPASVPVGNTPPASGAPPVVVPAPASTIPVRPILPGTPPGGPATGAAAPTATPYVPFAPPVGELESIDVNQATQTAQNNRPEVRRNAVLLRASETGIQVARSGQQPSFALSASGNYYPTTSFQFPRQRTAAITASVSIPFYDGGATKARINEARLQTENARTAFGSSQSGVALEVQQAYLTLSTAARQITAANAAVEQAIAARQLAQIRYEGQVGLFLEVTDAQAALVRAESAQVNAVYDYLIARAQFVNAVGTPTYLTATAPPPALPSTAPTPATPAVPATPAPGTPAPAAPTVAPNAPAAAPATPQK